MLRLWPQGRSETAFLARSILEEGHLCFTFNDVNPMDEYGLVMRRVLNSPVPFDSCIVYRKKSSVEVLRFVDYLASIMRQ